MARNDDRLFLITGATGRTGTTSVHLLLARGHRVRAFVHRHDDRSEALAAAGAEIAAGDLQDRCPRRPVHSAWSLPGDAGTAVTSCDCAAADRKSTRLNSSHLGISYAVF